MMDSEENKENNDINSVKVEPDDAKLPSNHLNGVANEEVIYTQYESELQMKVSFGNPDF